MGIHVRPTCAPYMYHSVNTALCKRVTVERSSRISGIMDRENKLGQSQKMGIGAKLVYKSRAALYEMQTSGTIRDTM